MTLTAFAEAAALGVPVGLALGLVGGGGSILTVPILVGVLGVSLPAATGASLLIVAVNAGSALGRYAHDRLVQVRVAVLVALSGLAGTVLGTALNRRLEPRVLALAFAALMVVIAGRMLRGQQTGPECPERLEALPPAKLLAVGTRVGLTTGLFGVGGGFVVVPALLSLGLCMRQAVPTSLLVVVLNSVAALLLRSASGSLPPLGYALPMIGGGLVGTAVAVRLAPKLGNVGLTRAFALLVLALAPYLVWKGCYV